MDLNITFKIGKREFNLLDTLVFLAMILVGILLRVFLFEYESLDYTTYLEPWTSLMSRLGFSILKDGWYNYTGLYMYALFFISKLPFPYLVSIKLLSVIFDLLLAIATAKAVKTVKENVNPLIVFAIVWFAPTVIFNSSMWGQCDSIYAFFLIMSFMYFFKEDSFKGMLFFSIAFALKLQTIFFAPVIILLFFLKKIKFYELFLVPAVYFVSIIPLWIAGRPLKECLLIYLNQTEGKNDAISINYPNIYYMLNNDCYVELYHVPAVLFTVGALLIVMYYVLKKCYEKGIDNNILIQTALLSGSLILFFLPNMRERYSFVVDIIAILYAFTIPKKLYVPVLKFLISAIAYQTYFVYGPYFDYTILAFIQIFLIFDCTVTLIKTLREKTA